MTLGLMPSGSKRGSGDQRDGYVEANETVKISMMHASLSQTLEFLNVSLSLPAATRSHIMGYKRHFVKNFLMRFHAAVHPPSMVTTDPFTKSASEDAKYRAMCAISVA